MIARVAIAAPIEPVVKGLPVGASTAAPAFRQRSASRISAVTTTASGPAAAAIQSSAASNASLTTTRSISGCLGTRKWLLLTTDTRAPSRSATR